MATSIPISWMGKVIVAASLFMSSIPYATSEQWLYIDPLRPNRLFSIRTEPVSFGIDDVQNDAKICSPEDAYHCIESSVFKFYVPKNLSASTHQWTAGGETYTVAMKSRVSLFGLEDEIYFIDKQNDPGKGVVRFLYSKLRGLIGIGGYTDNTSAVFLLDVDCGFGAAAECSAQGKNKTHPHSD